MLPRKDSDSKAEIEPPEFAEYDYGSHEEVDEGHRKEKALVRRLDCFVIPVIMLLNLISYLDRGNIGFAATQGMAEEIHLKGTQLNVYTLPLLYISSHVMLLTFKRCLD